MIFLCLLSCMLVIPFVCSLNTVRVLFIYEEDNIAANRAVDVAVNYMTRNPQLEVNLEIKKVVAYKNESTSFLNTLCSSLDSSLSSNTPPHLVFDTTLTGYPSETVKYFVASLGLPTMSASFGDRGDLRKWRELTQLQQMYLLQVRPPPDIIAEIVRPMVIHQKIPNLAIFHDNTFVLQHKYKSLLLNFATRHTISLVDPDNIKQQILTARYLDIANFFILGNLTTVNVVLESACSAGLLTRRLAWHVITVARIDIEFPCPRARVILARPKLEGKDRDRMEVLKEEYKLTTRPEINAAFYFDLMVHSVVAVKNMQVKGLWPADMPYITCNDYTGSNTPSRHGLNFKIYFQNNIPSKPIYGTFVIDKNGQSAMQITMEILGLELIDGVINKTEELATWESGNENNFTVIKDEEMKSYINDKFFQVITVEQKPFIYVDNSTPRGFRGYCIDLMDEIARLCNFKYDIRLAVGNSWGSIDDAGQWSGAMRDLLDRRADIGLGAMSVMAEREAVVDFSIPFYDLVGIGILMKQESSEGNLFKFLTVLESEVWIGLLITYCFTSLIIYIFDRLSPFSFSNNRFLHRNTTGTRLFTIHECFWFCITSLTPQGGGEAPKNPSGRLIAATWWLFGFIIIASYTANLAAFLTVSRLDTSIEGLHDLSMQYKVQFAPTNGSSSMVYFKRMANIEDKFYEIWKEMSLNNSNPGRSNLAVWEYPLSNKYIKLWEAMLQTGLPKDRTEALERVRDPNNDFAYLGDATDLKYMQLINCDLRVIGEEFSRKPYAIAIQKGHPLKEQVNNAILTMVNKRQLTQLKDKWWVFNPEAKVCDPEEITGISIQNIAGVFIVVLIGISLSIVMMTFELWRKKYLKKFKDKNMKNKLIGGKKVISQFVK